MSRYGPDLDWPFCWLVKHVGMVWSVKGITHCKLKTVVLITLWKSRFFYPRTTPPKARSNKGSYSSKTPTKSPIYDALLTLAKSSFHRLLHCISSLRKSSKSPLKSIILTPTLGSKLTTLGVKTTPRKGRNNSLGSKRLYAVMANPILKLLRYAADGKLS